MCMDLANVKNCLAGCVNQWMELKSVLPNLMFRNCAAINCKCKGKSSCYGRRRKGLDELLLLFCVSAAMFANNSAHSVAVVVVAVVVSEVKRAVDDIRFWHIPSATTDSSRGGRHRVFIFSVSDSVTQQSSIMTAPPTFWFFCQRRRRFTLSSVCVTQSENEGEREMKRQKRIREWTIVYSCYDIYMLSLYLCLALNRCLYT